MTELMSSPSASSSCTLSDPTEDTERIIRRAADEAARPSCTLSDPTEDTESKYRILAQRGRERVAPSPIRQRILKVTAKRYLHFSPPSVAPSPIRQRILKGTRQPEWLPSPTSCTLSDPTEDTESAGTASPDQAPTCFKSPSPWLAGFLLFTVGGSSRSPPFLSPAAVVTARRVGVCGRPTTSTLGQSLSGRPPWALGPHGSPGTPSSRAGQVVLTPLIA